MHEVGGDETILITQPVSRLLGSGIDSFEHTQSIAALCQRLRAEDKMVHSLWSPHPAHNQPSAHAQTGI